MISEFGFLLPVRHISSFAYVFFFFISSSFQGRKYSWNTQPTLKWWSWWLPVSMVILVVVNLIPSGVTVLVMDTRDSFGWWEIKEKSARGFWGRFSCIWEKEEKRWSLFSPGLVLSGCDIWDCCSRFSSSSKAMPPWRRAAPTELQKSRTGAPFTMPRATLPELLY